MYNLIIAIAAGLVGFAVVALIPGLGLVAAWLPLLVVFPLLLGGADLAVEPVDGAAAASERGVCLAREVVGQGLVAGSGAGEGDEEEGEEGQQAMHGGSFRNGGAGGRGGPRPRRR